MLNWLRSLNREVGIEDTEVAWNGKAAVAFTTSEAFLAHAGRLPATPRNDYLLIRSRCDVDISTAGVNRAERSLEMETGNPESRMNLTS